MGTQGLRHRLVNTSGKITMGGRTRTFHLAADGPWATLLMKTLTGGRPRQIVRGRCLVAKPPTWAACENRKPVRGGGSDEEGQDQHEDCGDSREDWRQSRRTRISVMTRCEAGEYRGSKKGR